MQRVLIVDEDAGFLAFAAEALHSFQPGFDVVTARNLGEAGEWLGSFPPDLLLLGPDAQGDDAHVAATTDPTREMRVVRLDASAGGITLPALLETVRAVMEH